MVVCAAMAVVAASLVIVEAWAWWMGVASLVAAVALGSGRVARGALITTAAGPESRAFLASVGSVAALWGVAIGGAPLLLAPQDGLPLAIAVGVLVVLAGLGASVWIPENRITGPFVALAGLVGLVAAGLPAVLLSYGGGTWSDGGVSGGTPPGGLQAGSPGLGARWAVLVVAVVVAVVCGAGAWVTAQRRYGREAPEVAWWTVAGLITASSCALGVGLALFLDRSGGPLTLLLLPATVWMVTVADGRMSPSGEGAVQDTAPVVFEADKDDGEWALSIGEERRRATQLQILNRLALVLNSEEDATRMLDQVLRGATQLLGARSGSLYLMADGRLQLEALSFVRGGSPGPDPRHQAVEVRALAVQAMAEARVIRLPAAGEPGAGDGALMAAPLVRSDGEVLGSFVMAGSSGACGFEAADEMMAGTLAAHVTVALQNRQRLEQEQQVAEYLQRAMLPRAAAIPGLELDVTYESASEAALVGGDFYDVIPVDATKTCLAVGDVCGKGLAAATEMAMVRHTVRAFASLGLRTGRWLTLCNQAAVADGEATDYITVALVLVDTSTRTLDYAMAGHPPPIVALPQESWELAGRGGLPIGSWREQQYETHRVVLPKGATLILYTDGLYEARRPGGRMFGEEELAVAVREVAAAPLGGAAARLVAAARAHAGGRLADDVVVVAVRIPPPVGETGG